ncbi:exodeoxyribonuclease VII large subunit [Pararhodospirillum photometricum]|nr:exodeoxyribonuclease VII large subunit [Pararhodospirillum photometricum]
MTDPAASPARNVPELSVSELSGALRRTLEEAFGHVRVRGEISQPKTASSGHCYLRLKDDQAVIDAIIWRGSLAKMTLRPEEGLEVIATGRLTTYPGRSSYQIIIESLELAGEGALLKMLEERRRRLAAEGLFDPQRKRPLPFLPRVIGVVTSPTGAVIRDILHRLSDRFPVRVLVWPVAVQGDAAPAQIVAALEGFNALAPDGPVPRPDLLIVARGGGSLEDLMAFNDEAVVRAAAASAIPLISAVGHETDVTLIDHAADYRAPTPTGAAERAVPVRLDLQAQVRDLTTRQDGALRRFLQDREVRVAGLARGLPQLERLLEGYVQRLDDRAARLDAAPRRLLDQAQERVRLVAARLRRPADLIARKADSLERAQHGLDAALTRGLREAARVLEQMGRRLRPESVARLETQGRRTLADLTQRLDAGLTRDTARRAERLNQLALRLDSVSYRAALRRGYVVVRRAEDGRILANAAAVSPGMALTLDFHDGAVPATAGQPARPRGRKAKEAAEQGDLLEGL